MDSLPQELINAIINNVPDSSLRSCSLVAKRWRRGSQQRAFIWISITSEYEANLWCKNIPQGPGGTSSFVRIVHFIGIRLWDEPTLFGRVLKGLTSLTTLWVASTEIPDKLQDQISCGELGKKINSLVLFSPLCTHATMMSIIISLPSLKWLIVQGDGLASEEPLSIHPITSWVGPLKALHLRGDANGVGEILVKSRFMSHRLTLDLSIPCAEQLIVLSAETMVGLSLYDTPAENTPSSIHLPSLAALATLCVDLRAGDPSPHLTNFLYSVSSAPALTSVVIKSDEWPDEYSFPSPWVEVDKWLVRMVEHARVKGGLRVMLKRWPEGKSVWKGLLHRFTEVGGKLTVCDG